MFGISWVTNCENFSTKIMSHNSRRQLWDSCAAARGMRATLLHSRLILFYFIFIFFLPVTRAARRRWGRSSRSAAGGPEGALWARARIPPWIPPEHPSHPPAGKAALLAACLSAPCLPPQASAAAAPLPAATPSDRRGWGTGWKMGTPPFLRQWRTWRRATSFLHRPLVQLPAWREVPHCICLCPGL